MWNLNGTKLKETEQTGGFQRQGVKVVKKYKRSFIRLINSGDKTYNMGFPGGSDGKSLPAIQET